MGTLIRILVLAVVAGGAAGQSTFVLEIPARSGALTSPMAVASEGGEQFVTSSVKEQGAVRLSCEIPNSGPYVIWARVFCTDEAHDSLFVKVGDGPEDVFDAAEQTWGRWHWRTVNGRDGDAPQTIDPRVFDLTAGRQDIVFRGREPGARLERIIITNDRAFAPPGAVLPPETTFKPVEQVFPGKTVYRIHDKALHLIDDRLFGQFMERPSGGEIGIEAAVIPGTHRLRQDVLKLLSEMHLPIVRFPAGTDVDYIDWRDMVSNVPGRSAERPVTTGSGGETVTNYFGYDEFLRLCRQLKAEPILVVNLGDALTGRKSPGEAANHAASLVAYCNTAVGAARPTGIEDWPAVRATNGAPEPYGVHFFQIGNETGTILGKLRSDGMPQAQIEQRYVECLVAYVQAMRGVDPSIRLLADIYPEPLLAKILDKLPGQVDFWVQHVYTPHAITNARLRRDGVRVDPAQLTAEDVWKATVAIPNSFDDGGESLFDGLAVRLARQHRLRVAITEWNWNGYWHTKACPLDSVFARGVGDAGFLHAFMRAGDVIDIACQSMTVGRAWNFTAIHVDPNSSEPAYMLPSGQVVMFYAKHHGNVRLEMEGRDVPTYAQPLRMGDLTPKARVATVDALATANDKALFFHAINRHFTEDVPVTLDLADFPGLAGEAVQHVFEGRLADEAGPGEPLSAGSFRDAPLKWEGSTLRILLAKRSVSIVELPRASRAK